MTLNPFPGGARPLQVIPESRSSMAIPDRTSPEAYLPYTKGKCLRPSRGKAWKDLKAWIIEPLRQTDTLPLPAVSEAYLAWTFSGVAEFQEREADGPWITHRIQKGSFFLTTGGEPYDCRWRTLTPEPFLTMMAFVELPVLQRAMEESFGQQAPMARLRDLSAFTDPDLNWMMEKVRDEVMAKKASVLRVQGLAQLIATHLARNYAEISTLASTGPSALPAFKLKQVTDWIEANLEAEFDLEQLAGQAGFSKFHFHRLFKQATGLSPAQYQRNARLEEARRRLRETGESIIGVAMDLGFQSASHFAQVFRRETGMSPSEFRSKG